jgi:frataxin-like iron-binding protein CyaY
MKSIRMLLVLLSIFIVSTNVSGQAGLIGTWKYASAGGEMIMQINAGTIVINNQSFSYKAQGNVLMINEMTKTTPYPYMLDGDLLTLEFPGGTEIVFNRVPDVQPPQSQLPQSMTKSPAGAGQGQQSSTLSGKWLFQNQQGQLALEFLSANQLIFNGETAQYQLKEGSIQVMGDYGWIDYPFILNQGLLTITFPDGSKIPFTKAPSTTTPGQFGINQPNANPQATGAGLEWQLNGSLCSWSGSSGSASSYSRTQKIVFDGRGNFQFGSESSFSSNAGIAYSGNPNVETGTYRVGENSVTLNFKSGETYQVKINMRQNNGTITELMHSGTLYAKGLCN